MFIKAVFDTVLDMVNAVYYDKPMIFIKAVSNTVPYMMNAAYYAKPLIFTGAICLCLSRLFLTLY